MNVKKKWITVTQTPSVLTQKETTTAPALMAMKEMVSTVPVCLVVFTTMTVVLIVSFIVNMLHLQILMSA